MKLKNPSTFTSNHSWPTLQYLHLCWKRPQLRVSGICQSWSQFGILSSRQKMSGSKWAVKRKVAQSQKWTKLFSNILCSHRSGLNSTPAHFKVQSNISWKTAGNSFRWHFHTVSLQLNIKSWTLYWFVLRRRQLSFRKLFKVLYY